MATWLDNLKQTILGKRSSTKPQGSPSAPTRSPLPVRQLREQVEANRLRVEELRLRQQVKLMEAIDDPVTGTPVDFNAINSYRGQPLQPIFYRNIYQSKAVTVRTVQRLDLIRNLARYAYETNPNVIAAVDGLRRFVAGCGFNVVVSQIKEPGDEEAEIDPAAKQEIARAQRILDRFISENKLKHRYGEAFRRCHVEGEVFLRLFPDELYGTSCRFVEPDNIRPPQGENWEGAWSFGVKTSGEDADGLGNIAWDTETPLAYNLNYPISGRDEQIAASEICHLKINVNANVKRGLPSLYAVDEEARGTQKLRYAAREGAKIRASIPYIREHEMADGPTIQNLTAGMITDQVQRQNGDGSTREVDIQQIEPGMVADVPASMKYHDPPSDPNGDSMERIVRLGLEALAARFNAPLWLISGAANDSSFAAALMEESPFLRCVTEEQETQTEFWKDVFLRVLDYAVRDGVLQEGIVERVHVIVTAHSPQVRKKKEESDTLKQEYEAGLISMQEWAAATGREFNEQQSQRKQEAEMGIVPPKPKADVGRGAGGVGREEGGDGEDGDDDQGGDPSPKTIGGERQREEGTREQYQEQFAEAFSSGYAAAAVVLAERPATRMRLQEAEGEKFDESKIKRDDARKFADQAGRRANEGSDQAELASQKAINDRTAKNFHVAAEKHRISRDLHSEAMNAYGAIGNTKKQRWHRRKKGMHHGEFTRHEEMAQFIKVPTQKELGEQCRFLEGTAVASLHGNEVPYYGDDEDGIAKLKAWVTDLFQRVHHGKAMNPTIGKVNLNKKSVSDSVGHGITETKATAFAAVPKIIEHGRILSQGAGGKTGRLPGYIIGAPIEIKGNQYVGIAVVRKEASGANFYLHEVRVIKMLQDQRSKSVLPPVRAERPTADQGAISNLLRDIFSVKSET